MGTAAALTDSDKLFHQNGRLCNVIQLKKYKCTIGTITTTTNANTTIFRHV
jgi:hypothetical protein